MVCTLQLRMAALNAEERDEAEAMAEAGEDTPLLTAEDVADVLGECEAPLIVPSGYEVVALAPQPAELDSSDEASDALVNKVILLRFENFGWCKGTVVGKVNDGRRRVGGVRVNFIAEFDMDEGAATDLTLEASTYDTSPSADYQAWMLLQEETSQPLSGLDTAATEQ